MPLPPAASAWGPRHAPAPGAPPPLPVTRMPAASLCLRGLRNSGVLRPSEVSSTGTEASEVARPAQSHSGALGQIKQATQLPGSGGQELSPLFLRFSDVEM